MTRIGWQDTARDVPVPSTAAQNISDSRAARNSLRLTLNYDITVRLKYSSLS